jgi:hypothetical protein
MYTGLHVKYLLFLSYFNENLIFRQIFEKFSKTKFTKILPVGAGLFGADTTDGRTNGQGDIDIYPDEEDVTEGDSEISTGKETDLLGLTDVTLLC